MAINKKARKTVKKTKQKKIAASPEIKKISKRSKKFKKSSVNFMPIKRPLVEFGVFELAHEYGYINILRINGQDVDSLAEKELESLIQHYQKWLSQFRYDFCSYTTKLPTDTREQIAYKKYLLNIINHKLAQKISDKERMTLLKQKQINEEQIEIQEAVANEIYNTEFFMFVYGKDTEEVLDVTKKAIRYSNKYFDVSEISMDLKEKIIDDYNNIGDNK